MRGFVILVAAAVAVWLFLVVGLGWYIVLNHGDPESTKLGEIFDDALTFGASSWELLKPVVQLALIITVLIAAADHFGLGHRVRNFQAPPGSNSTTVGIGTAQSAIAVLIVGAYVIGSLVHVGDLGGLKDITLVVVGFYFGSRRSRDKDGEPTADPDPIVVPAPAKIETAKPKG